MTTIEALKNNIQTLENSICKIQKELTDKKNLLKEELLKLDKVKGLAEYILFMGYPREIYYCWSSDSGEYDSFGDIKLKISYNYGYTDIVGLTEEEQSELEKLLGIEIVSD